MPSKKEPVGSTANLPPDDAITAAEDARETDIDELFGMTADESGGEGTATGDAATGGEATAAGAAGAAGAEPVDGQASAPALPVQSQTPPAEGAAPGQTATQPDGTSSAPSAQPTGKKPDEPPTPAAAPGQAATVDADKLRLQSLEATVDALQRELAAARAQPAPGSAPTGGPSTGQPAGQADDLPRYALQLPQPVAAALTSGDDQQTVAGITHMMNSLATIVHHNVRQEMRQAFGQLLQTARATESETANAQFIQSSREDYYKAFPGHKNPLILPIIQAESMAMAGEFPGLPWSEDYRNALGQRVEARLTQLRGNAAGGNGGQPPAQPAAMLPSGSRPETPGSELTGGDLIADTFS